MTRSVVVTGGTGALGRAVVRRFTEAGATVHVPWIVDEERRQVEEALGAAASRVRFVRRSVTVEEEVAALFRETGPVDILANIVGGFAYAALEKTDLATWQKMFELNATSAFLCCRAAAGAMRERRWGRIILVSSAPALNHGAANMSAYAAAKAAVLNFTESLAKELGPDGITVNALVPSVIDTPANRKAEPGADTSRWLRPDEIAGVVEFLASDAAAIVNGSAVNLTKG